MPRLFRALRVLSLALVLGLFAITALAAVRPTMASAKEHTALAHVRVLHASPDAPAVDVLVNGKPAVRDLAFGHITKYLTLEAGAAYDIRVVPAAAPSVTVLDIPNAKFGAGYATAAAIGLLHPGKTGNGFTVKIFADDNRNLEGKARIRVVHLSPNAPAVDVYAARNFGGFAKAVAGLTYPNATGYLALQPGFYRFVIAASPSSSTRAAVFKTPWRRLFPESTYTAWAIGALGNNFTVLLTADAGIAAFDR